MGAVTELQYPVLGIAVEQVVLVLHADEAGRAVLHRRRRLLELGHVEVRAADLAYLPLGHQLAQRAQRLGDGRLRIGVVELVEVDVVGAQPAQALLDG